MIAGAAVYRVASESSPNTEKTSGFRSRLYSAVSRGAVDLFPRLRQPCKTGQVRVGVGIVGPQALAHPAIDAVDERPERHPVAAAEGIAHGLKSERIEREQ